MKQKQRMIVGVSGATGLVDAVRALKVLRSLDVETHLTVSRAAELMRTYESAFSRKDLEKLADVVYPINDVGAPILSCSFKTLGMLIAPSSMRGLAEIASGRHCITAHACRRCRAEGAPVLVLMLCEAPLTLIHLRNMATLIEAGGSSFRRFRPSTYVRPRSMSSLTTR